VEGLKLGTSGQPGCLDGLFADHSECSGVLTPVPPLWFDVYH